MPVDDEFTYSREEVKLGYSLAKQWYNRVKDKKDTQSVIAKEFGFSDATISNYISAFKNIVVQKILDEWRDTEETNPPSISELVKISKMESHEDQCAKWVSYCHDAGRKTGVTSTKGDKSPRLKLRSEAELIAKLEDFQYHKKTDGSLSDHENGAYECLRWVLQQTSKAPI